MMKPDVVPYMPKKIIHKANRFVLGKFYAIYYLNVTDSCCFFYF